MQVAKTSLIVAAVMTAFGLVGASVRAAETAAEIPKDSYYNDPLTASERSGIAQEESVSPNDGQASVPPKSEDGVIPDAAIDDGMPSTAPVKADKHRKGESEAAVVLDDAKKNDKVTKKGIADCMKNWDPQTQMTKEEWKQSCRTTLEYFPGGQ